jgi:hypothetical protein
MASARADGSSTITLHQFNTDCPCLGEGSAYS